MGYFRRNNVNPNWLTAWADRIIGDEMPEVVIDELAELSCGIAPGGSDQTQRYAEHVRSHIHAAFLAGEAYGRKNK